MTAKKPKIVSFLQYLNLFFFTAAIATITLLHIYSNNFLDFLRLPRLIYEINPLVGNGWPISLHIYQLILIFSLFLVLIDALGLFFYSQKAWRFVSDITSFLGFLIIWPTALFFIYTIASAENLRTIDFQTSLVYFAITFSLFLLDLVTWFVDDHSFVRRRK